MKIMKFGGSSVGSAQNILRVADIIKDHSSGGHVVVVVSAMRGVTDTLIDVYNFYKDGRYADAYEGLNSLYTLHLETLAGLKLKREMYEETHEKLVGLFGRLITCLTFKRGLADCGYDYVVSFGERLSCILLSAVLQHIKVRAREVDSAELILLSNESGNYKVSLEETREMTEQLIYKLIFKGVTPVVTGFYGGTKDGKVVTLGRGGSDYTATILAYALDASEVVLWKEVDGIFTGDPKKGNNAKFIAEISYVDALDMAQKGAKVLHPQALKPVAEKEITVWVKNTFRPEFAGTKIWKGVKNAQD
ncbi:aspartate kinase [Patescibacteria group bacterium]|nr:aspartate kinase [Patescibacteria group bacterium]MCL5797915.1 aspartate kinase [Patescibacteria group bacterium]